MDDFQTIFIQNVKYYRSLINISQEQLAEKCNCATGTIGCIECGRQFPSFEMIIKIASALKIHPADLFLRNASANIQKINSTIKELFQNEIPFLVESKLNEIKE